MTHIHKHAPKAMLTALLLSGCALGQLAVAQTTRHTIRQQVPSTWRNVTVCTAEGAAMAPAAEVAIGHVGRYGAKDSYFAIRAVGGGKLPGYLDATQGQLDAQERLVKPIQGEVGYTDEYYDTFMMPSGARLSCQHALGDGPAA